MPKQRTDLTAPVRFSRMEYAKIQSVGTFYYKGSNLVFAVKGEKGKQPSPATGDVEQGFRRRRSVVAPEETSRTPTSKTVTVQAYAAQMVWDVALVLTVFAAGIASWENQTLTCCLTAKLCTTRSGSSFWV